MTENTKLNDGGAAFPQAERIGDMAVQFGGLSMRDYFAAKAMHAFFASPNTNWACISLAQDASEYAYKVADAMLKAREQ